MAGVNSRSFQRGYVVDTRSEKLTSYLSGLQLEMQEMEIWAASAPSPKALMSEQPFCVDTLPFERWLQFVMIPKFNWMISEKMALPNQCDIAPMAEEAFKSRKQPGVVLWLTRIDELLTVS